MRLAWRNDRAQFAGKVGAVKHRVPWKSARGLAHSTTLPRPTAPTTTHQRLGARRSSAAFARGVVKLLAVGTPGHLRTNYAHVALNHSAHLARSGEEFSQLCSYSTQMAPLNFCRFNSANMPFALLMPVPHGTSCALRPGSLRSLKCSVITRPSSFLRQSTGSRPERTQCPTSAHEPSNGLRPFTAARTVSGFQ